jgi:hypothetical protein
MLLLLQGVYFRKYQLPPPYPAIKLRDEDDEELLMLWYWMIR